MGVCSLLGGLSLPLVSSRSGKLRFIFFRGFFQNFYSFPQLPIFTHQQLQFPSQTWLVRSKRLSIGIDELREFPSTHGPLNSSFILFQKQRSSHWWRLQGHLGHSKLLSTWVQPRRLCVHLMELPQLLLVKQRCRSCHRLGHRSSTCWIWLLRSSRNILC